MFPNVAKHGELADSRYLKICTKPFRFFSLSILNFFFHSRGNQIYFLCLYKTGIAFIIGPSCYERSFCFFLIFELWPRNFRMTLTFRIESTFSMRCTAGVALHQYTVFVQRILSFQR